MENQLLLEMARLVSLQSTRSSSRWRACCSWDSSFWAWNSTR